MTLAKLLFEITPISCRVEIRKGLNALKREIPGGDTFMHLGLERVGLCRHAFSCSFTLKVKLFSKERIKFH